MSCAEVDCATLATAFRLVDWPFDWRSFGGCRSPFTFVEVEDRSSEDVDMVEG